MNKHLLPQKSTLFKNKIKYIIENIRRSRSEGDLQTEEAYTREAIKILAAFYQTVTGTNFLPIQVRSGTSPELDIYNNNLNAILDDLNLVYAELENVEGVVIEQFNLFAAHSNRLSSRLKRLSSQVTDFALFSKLPIKNSFFFSDTFSDLLKTDSGSSLLNSAEGLVSPSEGIVTLPVNTGSSQTLSITLPPLVNQNSNGRPGNNQELNKPLNNNITAILDDNADTWFEYEKVSRTDDGAPVVLDFTVNLGETKIINFLRLNPNNFGTKSPVDIIDISTSRDGQLYVSIKDDIPIAGFLTLDQDNVFQLAPSTSKFAGQGLYTFMPRQAKYIRIVLRQSSPYLIETVSGKQFRYAIGIRDVEVKQLAYESVGEIISNPFLSEGEIKKVALRVNQNPVVASELAAINHFLSVDNGNTWHPISPLEDDGIINSQNTTPEIVNINTGPESIETENPVFTIRHKAILERFDENFTESSASFATEITDRTELKSVPQSQPWFLELDRRPIIDSVSVIDPGYGSRGYSDVSYMIGVGNGESAVFTLPFQNLNLDLTKTFDVFSQAWETSPSTIQTIFVNGEKWERVGAIGEMTAGSKTYVINGQELIFGASAPPSGALIEMTFTPERLYPIKENEHWSEIQFPTSIDRSTVQISRRGMILASSDRAAQGTQVHNLSHRNIIIDTAHPLTFSPSSQTIFNPALKRDFSNGLLAPEGELDVTGAWSIDTERGIIYSFDTTADNAEITINYSYQSESILNSSDWEWGDELPLHKSVRIKESGWSPNSFTGFVVASGVNKIKLPHLAVIENSIQFTEPNNIDIELQPLLAEVPFLNGQAELSQLVQREQDIPTLAPVGPSDVASFNLNTPIVDDTSYGAIFNHPAFTTEVGSLIDLDTVGDYFINRVTGTVSVFTGGESFEPQGQVYYWSNEPNSIPEGAYSIDYKKGIIHLSRPIPSTGYRVNFDYADYFIKYKIAREVPSSDWELDPSAGSIVVQGNEILEKAAITIKPEEILRKGGISLLQGDGAFRPIVYQINYKYISKTQQNIADFAQYFSPALKDYTLQIITRNGLL